LALSAAALENVLLVDVFQYLVSEHLERGGIRQELERELAALEGRSAGRLLDRLREFGIPADLADRILDVIQRRNAVIHHLMRDPTRKVGVALKTAEGIDTIVADVDRTTADCQRLTDDLTILAVPGLADALGMTAQKLIQSLTSIDPTTIEDPNTRAQIAAVQVIRDALNWELMP
jgi:hypothetical protein